MASKKLGQHFLQNEGKIKKIVAALGVGKGDVVVEIGPGRGELTGFLLEAGARVVGIEKDRLLARSIAAPPGKLEIVYGDVREIFGDVVGSLGGRPYLLAGNIPYYLTGYLFRMIGECAHRPLRSIFTVQKEVAQRIALAEDGHMNILAASVLWWAEAHYITSIPRKMFQPPPRVDSAVLLLRTRGNVGFGAGGYDGFMAFVKILFAHPRKRAISNLSGPYGRERVESRFFELGIDFAIRPEKLSFMHIFRLYMTLRT